MPFSAEVFRVFIASPSDVAQEREAASAEIMNWNGLHAFAMSVVLLPVRWETHAAAEMGDRPQSLINKRVLLDCDFVIGIFWSRVGTPTGKAESGSIEEIDEAIRLNKRVLLYFSKKPISTDSIETAQLEKLRSFKNKCRERGLYFEFETVDTLRELIADHLTIHARQINQERRAPTSSTPIDPHRFFEGEYFREIGAALAASREQNKPLFLVIFDGAHPKKSKLNYSLGYFLEYQTTKRLVHERFIQAIVDVNSDGARQFVPADDPLENCLWVVLNPNGSVVRREGVYGNPDEGLRRVREVVAALAKH